MKQLPLTKQQLIAALISLSLGSVAQAALTINGGSSSESSARVSWAVPIACLKLAASCIKPIIVIMARRLKK